MQRDFFSLQYKFPWKDSNACNHVFITLFQVVKPFLEPKTRKKVKFVYADDVSTMKIMEELFEMEQLESAFGGKSSDSFDIQKYAQRMKEDDEKMRLSWKEGNGASVASSCNHTHEISLSPKNDPSEEEEEEEDENDTDGRSCTPSSSVAEDSPTSTPDAGVSVATMSLDDPGHVKA